jgi:glycosyltransferase involved in cell wall biosynthesis
MAQQRVSILLVCDSTVGSRYRSGVQRVVVEAARALAPRCDLRLVRWDDIDGQLRDLDVKECRKLFGDTLPEGFQPNPASQRTAFRFVETIEDPLNSWLLITEVPHELDKGSQKLAAMRAQCREVGVRSALIFYDLIPVLEAGYAAARSKHLEYLVEAALCDRIYPISHFAAGSLLDYLRSEVQLSPAQLEDLGGRVAAVPLGEYREGDQWGLTPVAIGDDEVGPPRMIMLGTIEPRKQQVRLLKAINDAVGRFPELSTLQIDLFGSLHPSCAAALHAETERNPRIRYHQYGSDAQVEESFASSWFSAFVSAHEGYGLPIVESLRHGVPCLTASFGAMAEVADGGGCLLVDTLDDYEMVKAIRRLINEPALLSDLKQQIARRVLRSWGDYAGDIVDDLATRNLADRKAEDALAAAVRDFVAKPSSETVTADLHQVRWTITRSAEAASAGADRTRGDRASLLWLDDDDVTTSSCLFDADILAAGHDKGDAIIAATSEEDLQRLLPVHTAFGSNAAERAAETAVSISRLRGRALTVSSETALRQTLLRAFSNDLTHPAEQLAIVLSTYNRAPFVEHNVEWLLAQIDQDDLPVRCVVVDNASTDDTHARLQRFVRHPRFTLVENANNVGMLGNLRVCAAGLFAAYVWLTGDDDFIVPGRIQAVLDQIDQEPGLPLMVHNFAVYHRAGFSPSDHARTFLRERQHLAPAPSPDGIRPINQIAGEHDNLYTAIYPLVFRSDVLAACFDYPFTGVPFGDLTECIPTTKLLLGTYRYAGARWFAEVGIVGNAHNSWSSHRPRWHLILMPMAFQLAHDAGVDPERVWHWLRHHKGLFQEAVDICIENEATAHLDKPKDLAFAEWAFREKIEVDERLRLATPAKIKHWRRAS